MQQVLAYARDGDKTEKQLYVSGINCDPLTAYEQMQRAKRQFQKTDGIVAFHAYQAFAPGEATPEMAHAIGVKLAQELWGERFEVIVSTHLDKQHLHNHFVLNSVSFLDGKRYYDNKASYALLRQTSDRLCREHALSVIEHPEPDKAKHYGEWKADQDARPQKGRFFYCGRICGIWRPSPHRRSCYASAVFPARSSFWRFHPLRSKKFLFTLFGSFQYNLEMFTA